MPTSPSPQVLPEGKRVRLFGNEYYSVMLTEAGAGYSHWRDQAITRWHEDPTCDDWGSFILLRDMGSGALWSPTRQPLGADNQGQGADLDQGHAIFSGESNGVTATLAVAVADDLKCAGSTCTIAAIPRAKLN